MSEETKKIIEDMKESKTIANKIVEKAIERRTQLLSSTHKQAKNRIQTIKDANTQAKEQLKDRLDKENKVKEAESIEKTNEQIQRQEQNGEAHLDELVDLLYNTVLNVETE